MGELRDKARQQSKFLIIEKGGYAVVRYDDHRFIPDKRDPDREMVQYIVNEDGKKKYWENGSTKVMMDMDEIPKGSWIKISRMPWIDRDSGREDDKKSIYTVERIQEEAPSG